MPGYKTRSYCFHNHLQCNHLVRKLSFETIIHYNYNRETIAGRLNTSDKNSDATKLTCLKPYLQKTLS